MNLIFILFLIYSSFCLLSNIYLFQIKEYRFDRVNVFIQETGSLQFFMITSFRLPAITLRNIIICLLSLPVYMYIYREVLAVDNWIIYILLIILTPFIAFVSVLISVLVTDVLAYIKRRYILLQANKIKLKSRAKIIGVTGSFGKTTTKEWLYSVLSSSFQVAKTDNNMNTDIGVALSLIKNLKANTQYFIAEMGAYKKGEIKSICKLVKPKYGIITGIGNQHIALFGSQDNILKAKGELLVSLPKNGTAYVNSNEGFESFQKFTKCRLVSFGKQESDISIRQESTLEIPKYEIIYKKNTFYVSSTLPQRFLTNLLPVIGLSIDLGISPLVLEEAIPNLIQNLSNQLIKVTKQGMKVIDSSYNINVEAFISNVDFLKSFGMKYNIIISKGIIELGENKTQSYNKILHSVNDSNAILLTTDPLFNELKSKDNVVLLSNETQILKKIDSYPSNETILAIMGRFSQKFIYQLF